MKASNMALRVKIDHALDIAAPAARIFPLACPVRELEWIDQWQFDLVYSESGCNENNCIFKEYMSFPFLFGKPGAVYWHTTLYDPEGHRVEFLLTCENLALIKWEVGFREISEKATRVSWNFTLTALSPEADLIGPEVLSERLTGIAGFLGDSLKHYCETGSMLKLS